MIQHFYYLEGLNDGLTLVDLVKRIREDLKAVWGAVNPRLPLISDNGIMKKIQRTLESVKKINRGYLPPSRKNNLAKSLDRLFDVSACKCKLPSKLPCSDRYFS